MIKQVTLESIYQDGTVKDKYVTVPLYLNENSIVSVRPANMNWGLVKEINDKPVNHESLTEIIYSVGSKSEKVVALGEISQIMNLIGGTKKRELLRD